MRATLGLLLAFAPCAAFAAPSIADASFEAPATSSYTYTPGGTPWTYSGPSGVAASGGPFFAGSPPNGSQAAFIQSGGANVGGVSQTLTGLVSGSVYSFSFYATERVGYIANPIDVKFDSADLGTFTPTTNTFVQFITSAFTAGGTSGVLSFNGAVTNLSDIDSAIDAVSINTLSNAVPPVPEPASMALLAAGLVAVAFRRKRA